MLRWTLRIVTVIAAALLGYVLGAILWAAMVTVADAALFLFILIGKPGKMTIGDLFVLWWRWFRAGANRTGLAAAAVVGLTTLIAALTAGTLRRAVGAGRMRKRRTAMIGLAAGAIFGGLLAWRVGRRLSADVPTLEIVVRAMTVIWTMAGVIVGAMAGAVAGAIAGASRRVAAT